MRESIHNVSTAVFVIKHQKGRDSKKRKRGREKEREKREKESLGEREEQKISEKVGHLFHGNRLNFAKRTIEKLMERMKK